MSVPAYAKKTAGTIIIKLNKKYDKCTNFFFYGICTFFYFYSAKLLQLSKGGLGSPQQEGFVHTMNIKPMLAKKYLIYRPP